MKTKNIKKNILIVGGVALLATSTIALADTTPQWAGTDWIADGQDIDPVKMKSNFDWLKANIGNNAPITGGIAAVTEIISAGRSHNGNESIDLSKYVTKDYLDTQLASLMGSSATGVSGLVSRSGNIGIGTTNPGAELELKGDGKIRLSSDNSSVKWDLDAWENGGFGIKALLHYDEVKREGVPYSPEHTTTSIPFFVSKEGNIGIGTTKPTSPLTVKGAIEFFSKNKDDSDTDKYTLEKIYHSHDNNELRLTINDNGGSNESFQIWGGACSTKAGCGGTGQSLVTFQGGGNVGIGTTSPTQKLTVNGNIAIKDNNTQLQEGSGNALRVRTNSGYIDVGAQNTSWAHIYTDRPKVIFNKDVYTTTNTFSSYNNDLILKRVGRERIRVNSKNVIIGSGDDVELSKSHNGFLMLGSVNGLNVSIDNNEIMARNNGKTSTLYIQDRGGMTKFGGGIKLANMPDKECNKYNRGAIEYDGKNCFRGCGTSGWVALTPACNRHSGTKIKDSEWGMGWGM